MEAHLSRDPLMQIVVQRGPYEYLDKDGKVKDVDVLTADELSKVAANGKARSTLINGLNQAEYDKVSSLKTAKEIWDALETYHEGSKALKKVKLGKLMKEFGSFAIKKGESIRESQARFQVTLNSLERLGKKIPQSEINMNILNAVPFEYGAKVTALESALNIDTMDHLAIFAELEQFEAKIEANSSESSKLPTKKMKNLALHSSISKLETDEETESDDELALMSRKIKRMIEKKNKMKREKGKAFGVKKDPMDDACFECGKKGHFKRDCYKLKNKSKPPRQQADYKNKKKSKALLTWSDDEDESASDDSSDEMVNLALVGLDGSIDTTDSDTDTNSEVNSINSELNTIDTTTCELTMQDKSCLSIMELIDLKNENYELEKENVHLKKVIGDFLNEKSVKASSGIIATLSRNKSHNLKGTTCKFKEGMIHS
uniref:CCHC-type domain-containing protein n=1 Tax=Daucus carota subsp. sativus TaxID=79200 RepID=A0A161ZLB0_DAUCS